MANIVGRPAATQSSAIDTPPYKPIPLINLGMPQRIEPQNVVTFYVAYNKAESKNNYYVQAMVNPTSFTESLNAEYSRRPVIGLSHEVLQFSRTINREISMELWVSYSVLIQRFREQDKISISMNLLLFSLHIFLGITIIMCISP